MTPAAAFNDLLQNGPLWAQLAYLALALFVLTGPALIVVGLFIEWRNQPGRKMRRRLAQRRR